MTAGKNRCKILKEIRQKIADENDIPFVTQECTYQGECRGTCPRCEEELRYLEQQLAKRQRLGKTVAVAAICAGVAITAKACSNQIIDQMNSMWTGLVAADEYSFEEEHSSDALDGEWDLGADRNAVG